jgi:hypothetical protein
MPEGSLTGSVYDAIEFFYGKPWSDGLPVVPPTPELVAHMLTGTRHDAD